MAVQISILLAGSAVLLLSGGKKKRPKRSSENRSCDKNSPPPPGTVCRDGILYPLIIDESMLDDDDLPPEGSGNFSTKEEDLSPQEGEAMADEPSEIHGEEDNKLKCEEFLRSFHIKIMNEDEIPINRIAVEQTVLPAMKSSLASAIELDPSADADSLAPIMIESALAELVPFCEWKYDENLYEFTFDGNVVKDSAGREVIYGLFQISDKLIGELDQGIQE